MTSSAPSRLVRFVLLPAAVLSGYPGCSTVPGPDTGPWKSVEVGGSTTCLLSEHGAVRCYGGLEDQDVTGPITKLSISPSSLCGLTEGGQLDCGARDFLEAEGEFLDISVGMYHACGISTLGETLCWGEESAPIEPPQDVEFVALALNGSDSSCGLRDDGRAMCWGEDIYQPDVLDTLRFRHLDAGLVTVCGVTDGEASLFCWGRWGFERRSPSGDPYVEAAAGFDHACARRESGAVDCWSVLAATRSEYCWENYDRFSEEWYEICVTGEEYGQGTAPDGEFISLGSGSGHSCALAADEALECWGLNDLCQADPLNPDCVPEPPSIDDGV